MPILVVSLIIRDRSGNYLMGRKVNSDLYCPPGGKVEEGEKLKRAGQRELREETNLRCDRKDMKYIGYAEENGKLIMFFEPQMWGQLLNMEPHKCKGWEWIDLDTVPEEQFVEGIKIYKRRFHARSST